MALLTSFSIALLQRKALYGYMRAAKAEIQPALSQNNPQFPITKTHLFKYIENVPSKKWTFSDKKKSDIFFKFLLKT